MASRSKVRKMLLNKRDSRLARTQKEAVQWYYGHRLTVEEPHGEYLVWRLSLHGRTIACSEDEHEVWSEAFDELLDLLECDSCPQAYGGPVLYA